MATLAIDRPRPPLADFARLLAPSPGRLEFAARLALLCALTTWVVEYYQTPAPALTAYVSFFLIHPDRASSVIQSIAFVIIITLVIGILLLVTKTVVDYSGWRVAAMALISLGLTFCASASKLKPVANITALICAYALDLVGNFQVGELATRALLYAWLFVSIPAGLSIVLNLVLAPAPQRLAEAELARRLRLSSAMLRGADDEMRAAFAASLDEEPGKVAEWMRFAGLEKSSPAADIAALDQATHASMGLMLLVDFVERTPAASLPTAWRTRLAEALDEMAAIFAGGGYPVDIVLAAPESADELSPLQTAVAAELRRAIVDFTIPPPAEAKAATKPTSSFFLPDAFSNPDHLRYAVKTTAAAMICYVTYSLLDWPGIHTCLITCYIVSLGTAAETVEKLTLRILGCLIGAAAGVGAIVFLIPYTTSIGALMAVVFVTGLAAGWIAAGSPRISYVGFQLAFAFFLCVIQGPSPAFDLTIARDRVIGILFGNLMVFVLFTTLWPVSLTKQINGGIASLLRRLASIAGASSDGRRYHLATAFQSALSETRQNCDLALYEPAAIRRSQDWLDRRRRIVDEAAAVEVPLFLGATRDAGETAWAGARLAAIADTIDHPHRRQAEAPDEEPSATSEIEAMVTEHIGRIECLIGRARKAPGDDHAPA